MRKRQILLFSLLLLNSFVWGGNTKSDSLLTELELTQEAVKKIPILLELSFEYRYQSAQKAIQYAKMARELIKTTRNTEHEVKAIRQIGVGYFIKWELDTALFFLDTAYNKAISQHKTADLPAILNGIACVYLQKGSYQRSMEKFHEALAILEKEKNDGLHSLVLNNIGLIHWREKRPKQALTYFKSSLAIERRLNNPTGITMALNNMGLQYDLLEQWEAALKSYIEAYAIAKTAKNILNQSEILNNIGTVYNKQGKVDLAYDYFQEALKLSEETEDQGSMSKILGSLAALEQSRGNQNKAINYAQNGLKIGTGIEDVQGMTTNLETLIAAHSALKDYENAFVYKRDYHQLQDSIHNAETSKQILGLSAKYESEQKDIENLLLKEQQAKDKAIINQQRTTSLVVILVLILMTLTAVFLYQKNQDKLKYSQALENTVAERTAALQASNEELQNSNKDIKQFAYIASHDLQEPLRTVGNFVGLLKFRYKEQLDEEALQYIDFAVNGVSRMSQQIRSILTFSKVSQQDIVFELMDLNKVVGQKIEDFFPNFRSKNVQFNMDILPAIICEKNLLSLVFQNLISNAIKFNQHHAPSITISCQNDGEDFWQFSVKDNGIGIPKAYQNKIFEIFKRLHSKKAYKGTGIGLAICEKIIHRHGGKIWLMSKEGEGTTFYFTISKQLKMSPSKELATVV